MKSIFEYVEGRAGERLVQGVLCFLFDNDLDFRQAFCNWVKLSGVIEAVQEEVCEVERRHDILLTLADGRLFRIELKLWAGMTTNQENRPDSIDLAIVPKESVRPFAELLPGRVKSWSQLVSEVSQQTVLAKSLLAGLDEYIYGVGPIARAELQREMEIYMRGQPPQKTRAFFKRMGMRAQETGLRYSAASSEKSEYCGIYLGNKDGNWKNNLWLGAIFGSKEGRVPADMVEVVLQVCSKENAEKLRPIERLPLWFRFCGHSEGIVIWPDKDNIYTVEGCWEQCFELLKKYVSLATEQTDA